MKWMKTKKTPKTNNIFEVLGPLRWFEIHCVINKYMERNGVGCPAPSELVQVGPVPVIKNLIMNGHYKEAVAMLTIRWYGDMKRDNDGFWRMSFAMHNYLNHIINQDDPDFDWRLKEIDDIFRILDNPKSDATHREQVIYNILFKIANEP